MIIRLVRLPDINTQTVLDRYEYRAYGRFAVLRDGSFWWGELHSSHPKDTKIGWYWSISEVGDMLVSARGTQLDGESLFRDQKPILAILVMELVSGLIIAKPKSIEYLL